MQSAQAVGASSLAALVDAIRQVVGGPSEAATSEAVAKQLRAFISGGDLLTDDECEPDPKHYRQRVLHVEPDGSFSIVALVWLPGQATPIHDHVSWCVVGVHRGEELETRYQTINHAGETWLEETGQDVSPIGSVAALTPPGDIHRVENAGTSLAISIHVYGADIGVLGSSIRRRYDHPVRTR